MKIGYIARRLAGIIGMVELDIKQISLQEVIQAFYMKRRNASIEEMLEENLSVRSVWAADKLIDDKIAYFKDSSSQYFEKTYFIKAHGDVLAIISQDISTGQAYARIESTSRKFLKELGIRTPTTKDQIVIDLLLGFESEEEDEDDSNSFVDHLNQAFGVFSANEPEEQKPAEPSSETAAPPVDDDLPVEPAREDRKTNQFVQAFEKANADKRQRTRQQRIAEQAEQQARNRRAATAETA